MVWVNLCSRVQRRSIKMFKNATTYKIASAVVALSLAGGAWAQYGDRVTRLNQGTVLAVRTNESIDVERNDNRVYSGTLDQDVRGDDGRLALPRGSNVEMIVRVARDNDLILDIESVTANGRRYAIRTDPNRVESRRDNSLVGAIVGAINGGQYQGRA